MGLNLSTAASLLPGREFIEKAKAIGAKTEREREFIAAASALYDRLETIEQRTRILRHLRRRANTLGFDLVNRETGEVIEAAVS